MSSDLRKYFDGLRHFTVESVTLNIRDDVKIKKVAVDWHYGATDRQDGPFDNEK